jgi:hypothetical protein
MMAKTLLPFLLILSQVDSWEPGAVIPRSTYTDSQVERLLSLDVVREISESEAAEFTEEDEAPPAPTDAPKPTKPELSKVKPITAMTKAELAAFAAEQGIVVPDGTRAEMIAAIEAAQQGELNSGDKKPLLPDDI